MQKSPSTPSRPINPLIFLYLSGVLILLSVVNLASGFSLPIFLLLALLSLPLIIYRPLLGVLASLFTMILFERWFALVPFVFQDITIKIYPLDIFLFGSLLIAALRLPVGSTTSIPKNLRVVFFLYELIVVVVAAVSALRGADIEVVFSGVKNFAGYPLLAVLTAMVFKEPEDLRKLVKVFLFGGILTLVFFGIAVVTGHGVWTEFAPLSTTGERLFSIPHTLYASIAFLLLVSGSAHNVFTGRMKFFAPVLAFVLLVPIILSLHRHLWLGLIVGSIALVSASSISRGLRIARVSLMPVLLIAVAVGALVLVAPLDGVNQEWYALKERAMSLLELSHYRDVSSEWRALSWAEAVDVWLGAPIFGSGLDQSLSFEFEGAEQFTLVRDLHNDPLIILTQLGLLGFGCWITIFVLTLRNLRYHLENQELEWMRTTYVAVMILTITASIFSSYFQANVLIVPFWVLVGALWALASSQKSTKISGEF